MTTKFFALILVLAFSGCSNSGFGRLELEEICMDCCDVKYSIQDINVNSISKAQREGIEITIVSETATDIVISLDYPFAVNKYPFSGIYVSNLQDSKDKYLESTENENKLKTANLNLSKNSLEDTSIFITYKEAKWCSSGLSYKLGMQKLLK